MKRLSILLYFPLLLFGGCARTEIPCEGEEEIISQKSPGLSWSSSEQEVTLYDSENTFPTLSMAEGVTVSYASSDTKVATVDEGGNISLLAAGETTITASSEETLRFTAGLTSYKLTVLRAAAQLTWSLDACTAVIGADDNEYPTLSNPQERAVTYNSENPAVATIDAGGAITLVGAGETLITASSEENSQYSAAGAVFMLTVERASASLTWSVEEDELVFGQEHQYPSLSNPAGLEVSYSSTREDVAVISAEGVVTPVAAGITVITAASEKNSQYSAASASYTLTVLRAAAGLAWSEESATVLLGGDDNLYPTLSNPNELRISYLSSNTEVAAIAEDGTVTPLSAGATTITAQSAVTATHEAGSVSYTLLVIEEEKELEEAGLSWSATSAQVIYGAADNVYPTLQNPHSLAVSFRSSDRNVATISDSGGITLVAAGSVTITAESEVTDSYMAGSASYTLTVARAAAGLSWSADRYTATIGSENLFPALSNPNKLSISYSSTNTSVATVSDSGSVSLLSEGVVTITASSEETPTHAAGSASYTLTVKKKEPAAADLSWSRSSCNATLGQENEFPSLRNPNNLEVNYSSSSSTVASIAADGTITLVAAGTTTITASSEATDEYKAGIASYKLTVRKASVTLSWSEASYTATLEADNSFPTLSNPSGVNVSYSSSEKSVAGISASGAITLKAAGTTTITASFAGDDYYSAASASYVLTVVSPAADDGAVSTSFDSAGSSDDDNIANTSFTRLVTVTYSGNSATVSGYAAVSDVMQVNVSGAKVTINYSGAENVAYKLTGTSSDGFFKLYSEKKQALWLSGLSLTNPSGAAINNQSGKRTFVYVDGTNNLADGSSASYTTTDAEDMKAVFFSEGQIIFSGPSSGSNKLTVTANNSSGKSGIVSDDYVRTLRNVQLSVTAGASAGHGIRGKEYVQISNGTLDINTKAAMKKGIGSDDYVLVEGGTATINVSGGVAYDSDDKEYKGSAGIKADNYFAMTGGTVTITNSGAGGKGISAGSKEYYDTNKSLTDSYISGGKLTISTSGKESNDVSSKGVKIGWATKSGNRVTAYAGNMVISGGATVVNVTNSEGFEVKGNLTVTGGQLYVYSTGDDAVNAGAEMNISGGYVYAHSTANDGLDANHDMKISGGYVFAITTRGNPEVALDANTEDGYKLYIYSGATVVAYGGLERNYSAQQSVYNMSCTAGNWNALHNGSSYIAAFKVPSGISTVAVSAPSLSKGYKGVSVGGTTYANGIWATSGITGGTSVDLSNYSGGGSGPGGGGGPGGGPGGGGW